MKPYNGARSAEAESEDEGVVAHRAALTRRRRVWRRIFVGAGMAFLLVLALVTYSDAPPPEVSDLVGRERLVLADADNYYARLVQLADALPKGGIVPYEEPNDLAEGDADKMPDDWRTNNYVGFPDFLAAGRGWTPMRLALWDVALARLVDECAAIMEIRQSQAPQVKSQDAWQIAQIGEQLTVAAGMYRKAGYTERSVDILMLALRTGERVKNSRGGLRAYAMGQGMQSTAIRNLERLVIADEAAAGLIAAEWRKYRTPDAPKVFAEAMRMEYMVFATEVDGQDAQGASHRAPVLFRWFAQTRVLYPLVMKPNATKGLYADYLRQQVAWCDLPQADYEARGGHGLLRLEIGDVFRPVNLYGRLTAWQASFPAYAYARRAEYRAAVSVFEALLALRLYHAEHGTLPDRLDTLVPRYLSAVPVDYYDGASIRYSRESAEVWSARRPTERERLDFALPPAP